MRPPRLLVAVVLSLLVHGAPVIPLVARGFRLSAPPIPIEVRTSHRLMPRVPPPVAPEPPPDEASRPLDDEKKALPTPGGVAKAKKRRPGRKPAGPPVPPLPPPPEPADLRPFAPGDAKVVFLLRTDRLRTSPHRAAVELLLQAFPDYYTMCGGVQLDPLSDVDALLIATSNVFDVTATFLAARHAGDGRVRRILSQRVIPAWDPRVFSFPEPTLSIFARPTVTPPSPAGFGKPSRPAAAGLPVASSRSPAEPSGAAAKAAGPAAPDAGETPEDPAALQARWLDGLKRFEQLADEPGTPAVLVGIEDLDAWVLLGDDLPTPLSLALAITAEAAPALRVRAAFADADAAGRFAASWPALMARWRAAAGPFGGLIASLVGGLSLKQDGAALDVSGRIPETAVRLFLTLFPVYLRHASRQVTIDAAPPSVGPPSVGPSSVGTPSVGTPPLATSPGAGGAARASGAAAAASEPAAALRPSPLPDAGPGGALRATPDARRDAGVPR